ncbi:unnamed protein product [Eruca vesicaria subsp. sativa]|uniref:C2 domain-containing protein n=1 Tax=Eruca vesicaria subsp. sativa TaxID=29727 RepID=A0ABC8LP87_ERUVS|nr:unnamed protein product [Eruca vesicaria subsp. sativa]
MASSDPLDLTVTVVSAKHLKNVNWRNGDLKPYVVLYLDTDHRVSTRSDDSTKPVWNEPITLPLTRSVHESVLNIEIIHSVTSSDVAAKTLVGSVRFPLVRLIDSEGGMTSHESLNSLELVRPSGRTQGKIRLKLSIKERVILPPQRPQSQPRDYYSTPQGNHYYSPSPPPPPPMTSPYREFSPSPYPFTDHYYSGFYYPPPPPSRSMYDRASNYGPADVPLAPPRFSQPSGPSAPVEAFQVNEYKPPQPQGPPVGSRLSSYGVPGGPSAPVDYSPYDHRQLQKTVGGLSLEEERGGAAERSESEFGGRPSYGYGREYRREC